MEKDRDISKCYGQIKNCEKDCEFKKFCREAFDPPKSFAFEFFNSNTDENIDDFRFCDDAENTNHRMILQGVSIPNGLEQPFLFVMANIADAYFKKPETFDFWMYNIFKQYNQSDIAKIKKTSRQVISKRLVLEEQRPFKEKIKELETAKNTLENLTILEFKVFQAFRNSHKKTYAFLSRKVGCSAYHIKKTLRTLKAKNMIF